MHEITAKDYSKFIKQNQKDAAMLSMARHRLKSLQPRGFRPEATTIWNLPKCRDWATHSLNAAFRANWDPEVARNIILRYSEQGDTVLDPFVGSGTTLIECRLLGRKGIGVDLSRDIILLCRDRLNFPGGTRQKTYLGDARHLSLIKSNSIGLVATHPPYFKFMLGEGTGKDLASIKSLNTYIREMSKVAKELFRVLKPGKFCCLLMGDAKKHHDFVPVAYPLMLEFQRAGFKLKEDIIKVQHPVRITPAMKQEAAKNKSYFLVHEHLLVFRKP